MKVILVSAFEPFDDRALNASELALRALPGSVSSGMKLAKCTLPVETRIASEAIVRAIDELQPDTVLCLGEATRDALCVEQIGYNERRYTIPDNAGNLLDGEPIISDGPPEYRVTLPVEAMVHAMQAAGVPARLSDDPGRFLCNEVLYNALHHVFVSGRPIPTGFIHVPRVPETVGSDQPSLPIEDTVRGLLAALETLIAIL